jgi:hypothetical protein
MSKSGYGDRSILFKIRRNQLGHVTYLQRSKCQTTDTESGQANRLYNPADTDCEHLSDGEQSAMKASKLADTGPCSVIYIVPVVVLVVSAQPGPY